MIEPIRCPFIYAREGVPHAWLIGLSLKTLEVCILGPPRIWMLTAVHRGDRRVRAPPFEAIELELALLWAK